MIHILGSLSMLDMMNDVLRCSCNAPLIELLAGRGQQEYVIEREWEGEGNANMITTPTTCHRLVRVAWPSMEDMEDMEDSRIPGFSLLCWH